jgi:hypothetical protein
MTIFARLLLAWSVLAGALMLNCSSSNNQLAPPDGGGGGQISEGGDDNEVPLDSVITVAGEADIRWGTHTYVAPVKVDKELERRIFVAFLAGGQEVPAIATKALGAMAFVLNRQGTRLQFLMVHNVEGATVAHLHAGPPGENGPISIPLPSVALSAAGTLAITPAQVADLLSGNLYANIHSPANPKGEIRGQILRPGETLLTASLSGAEEVPAVTTQATGFASLVLSPGRDQIRYRVTVSGLTPTLAHIHRGIVGVNGPIVYPLAPVGALIEGNQTVVPADIEDLSRRQWYVNVHSAANPKGEMRGQVVRPGETYFGANLTAAQEVPPTTGTSTGNGMVVLGMGGAKFLYQLTTTATPTVAHIHRAPGGVNGAIEVPLNPISNDMFGVEDLGDQRAIDVARGLWYFNVHTEANPKGEIRGQILRPGETLYTAVLAGANEVPPVVSTASGGVGVVLNAARDEIRYDGSVTGITPTMAHIHGAPVGMNGPVVFPLSFDGTTVSGIQDVTADDVARLEAAGLYVNLHSAENPMGAARGQLTKQ